MIDNEKHCLQILELMVEDGKSVSEVYSQTEFWKVGGYLIMEEIKEKGLKNFRSHRTASGFYVPLYKKPYVKDNQRYFDKIKSILKKIAYKNIGANGDYNNFLEGYYNAFADYRVLCSIGNGSPPNLDKISESNYGEPPEHFVFEGKNYSKSFLNYLLGLAFIKKLSDLSNVSKIIEIGGGYGTLGEIFLKLYNNAFYVDIDLPPLSAVATYYLSEVFGEDAIISYDKTRDLETININEISRKYKVMILCPWQLPKLLGDFDLFANFISFQEMEPEIVYNYINQITRLNPKHVILRNLREGKEKKGQNRVAGVLKPMLLDDMITAFKNYKLIAKDVLSFGEMKIDNFHSELAYLTRK